MFKNTVVLPLTDGLLVNVKVLLPFLIKVVHVSIYGQIFIFCGSVEGQ